jgi:hypothetical protein
VTAAPYTKPYLDPFKAAAASLAVEAISAPVQELTRLEALSRIKPASRILALLSWPIPYCGYIARMPPIPWLLNEAIARCDGQDIRNWKRRLKTLQDLVG